MSLSHLKRVVVASLVLVLNPFEPYAFPQEPDRKQVDVSSEFEGKRVEGKATLVPFPSREECRLWIADIDLGTLNARSEVECTVTLVNDFDVTLDLQKLQTTCACVIPNFSGKQLSKGESLRFKIQLKTPGYKKDADFTMTTNVLDGNSNPVALLRLNGKIKGNLFLSKPVPCFVVRQGLNETRIPISISAPVTADSLSVELGPGLEKMTSKISAIDEEHCELKLSIFVDDPFVNTMGTVKISDTSLNISDQAELAIELFSPVTISPKFLTFSEVMREGAGTGVFECRAILRVQAPEGDQKLNDEELSKTEKKGELPKPRLTARIGERPIDTKLTEVGTGIFRLVFTCDQRAVEEIEKGKPTNASVEINGQNWEFHFLTTRRK